MQLDGIRVVDLVWEKNEVKRVNHVNLLLPKGQAVAMIGVESSGKRSVSCLLAGLERPTSGTILYEEKPVSTQRLKSITALICRRQGLIATLSVVENLVLGRRGYQPLAVPPQEFAEIKQLLTHYGLVQWLTVPVAQIPFMVQKRLLMLRAFRQGKQLIIVAGGGKNELLDSLSPILDTIEKLTQSGLSVLYTTDRMDTIAGYAASVLILRQGSIAKKLTCTRRGSQDLAEYLYPRKAPMVASWDPSPVVQRFLLQDRAFAVYGGNVVRICNADHTNEKLFAYLKALCETWKVPAPAMLGTEEVNFGWIENMNVMENLLLCAASRLSNPLGYVSRRKRGMLRSECEMAVGVTREVWGKYPYQLTRAEKLRLQLFRYRLRGIRVIIANCNELGDEDQATLYACAKTLLDHHCAILCVVAGMRAQEWLWKDGGMHREASNEARLL